MSFSRSICIAALTALLVACGQKGPLVLPQDDKPTQKPVSNKPAAESQTEDSKSSSKPAAAKPTSTTPDTTTE